MVLLCGFPPWGPMPASPMFGRSAGDDLKPWMWQSGIYYNGDVHPRAIHWQEFVIWAWTVCKIWIELKQMCRQGVVDYEKTRNPIDLLAYFWEGTQLTDLLSLLCIVGCMVLRLGVAYNFIGMPGDEFDFNPLTFCQILYGVAAIIFFFRFTIVMKLREKLGLLLVIVIEMVKDIFRWLILNVFITLGFCVAFTVFQPGEITSDLRPFWRPWWGMLGDFDKSLISDYFPESGMGGDVLVVSMFLLWFYVFLSTVVMVNLLIAQMSSTYGRLEEQAPLLAHYNFVDICREYKDLNDALPPPLNVLLVPIDLYFGAEIVVKKISRALGGKKKTGRSQEQKKMSTFSKAKAKAEDRYAILSKNFGSNWDRLQRFHVLMPPELASYSARRSNKALKTLFKIQSKAAKDATSARLERLERATVEMEKSLEQLSSSLKDAFVKTLDEKISGIADQLGVPRPRSGSPSSSFSRPAPRRGTLPLSSDDGGGGGAAAAAAAQQQLGTSAAHYAVLSQLYSKVGITYGAAAGLPSASAPPTPAALPYRSAPPLPPLGTAIAAAIQPPAQCFDTSRPATAPSGAEPSYRT